MNDSFRPALLPALLLAGIPLSSHSAEPQTKLEPVTVTAHRIEQSTATLSSSFSAIPQEDIEQVSATHATELMNRVPGVWITRGNGQEHLTAIRSPVLSGAGSCGAYYMAEDGVPVRPTGFCNVNQLFDLNTEQAGQIDVLRGPGSAMHSSDALHGVINVLSQRPSLEPERLLSLEAGPNDYGRAKVSVSDSNDTFGYRINFNGSSDGGYQHDSGYYQQKLTARFDYHGAEWSSSSLISASNLNQETAGYVVGRKVYKDSRLRRENPNPEAYRDTQTLRWQTRFDRDMSDGSTWVITPYARYSDMDFLMHFLPGTPLEENGQTSAGVQTSYHIPITPALMLTPGIDAEFTDAYLKQTQSENFSWSIPGGKQYDYEVQATLLAAFVNAQYQWNERTLLSVDTRYEFMEYDYDNRMSNGNTDANGDVCTNLNTGATGCRYSRPEDRNDTFENISANAGIVVRLHDAFTPTARISHGFRAPQATELYRLQEGQLIADLDSEEINSVELGFRGNAGSLHYDIVGFYMKKNNVIFQAADRQNLDNGQTRHSGVEYQISWQLVPALGITAAGSFAHHVYANDVSYPGSSALLSTKGNDMVSAPRRMSSVRVGWTPAEATRLELEWLAMGKYYTDLENQHHYDGHHLLHLRLRQQVSDHLNFGLRLINLANKDYAERADYSSFGGDRYFVGLPRTVYGDVQFKF